MFDKLRPYSILLTCFFAIVGILSIFIVAQVYPLQGVEGQGLSRFFGRFHPLALHFPVTCLVLVGVFELLALIKPIAYLKRLVGPLLFFSALTSVVTVVLGLLLAANEGHQGALVERHRMFGMSVAVLSCVAFVLYVFAQKHLTKIVENTYRLCLITAIGLMSFAAHDGGAMVHGPKYLAEHSPQILVPILTNHLPKNNASNKTISENNKSENTYISEATLGHFDSDVGKFIESYCLRCHGEGKQEANLRLDQIDPAFLTFNSQHVWQRVLGALGSHNMPPEDAKQPSDRQRMLAIDWIHTALEEHAHARRADMANAPLRRLNKRELNNTYQDLFKVDADFVSVLPSDPKSEHGYDNDAELLMVSMSDLKAYHGIARQAVQRYVQFGLPSNKTDKYFVEMEDVYHFARSESHTLSYQRAAQPLSEEQLQAIKLSRQTQRPIYRDRPYGPLPYGDVPQGESSAGEGRGFARLHEQFMLLQTYQTEGEVVVKVHAAREAGQEGDNSIPRLRLEAGWQNAQSLRVKNVGEYDITAPLDKPQEVEFRFRLEDIIEPKMARGHWDKDNRWILLVLSNVARHEKGIFAASIYGQSDLTLPSADKFNKVLIDQTIQAEKQQVKGLAAWQESGVPTLRLDALEAEVIPVKSEQDSPFIIQYPGANASLELKKRRLKKILSEFLPEVFRREHIAESEYKVYLDLFEKLSQSGQSFPDAVRETIAAALISPSFLYIGYSQNEQMANLDPQAYGNQYLASRLSYYLWSSMPDKTLRKLAEDNELSDPAILAAQVDRMLVDPKAQRFTQVFAKQWLQLAKLKDIRISKQHYPEFGLDLAQLMSAESVLTFQDNFQQKRDARELYFSEYMMINQQLARLYQVPNVFSGDIKRVHTGASTNRMGLLTQASVLAMNSDGEDSHPIKRGVWMLERLLNDPPPPPPPSVPELDTNNPELAGLSLKQKIEQHRDLSGCSGCHEKIDPWGLLMENYDATGMWRTKVNAYEKIELEKKQRRAKKKKYELTLIDTQYELNLINTVPVDASSVLPDGSQVKSLAEFSEYLKTNRQTQLMQAIVHHMMVYALGRELDILDEQESELIYSAFRSSGYKLSELTKAIVQSDGFTNRAQYVNKEVH
ncbi:DUF1592 domain-containing protein [Paraglaciecola aquimarina]|uniref:DUF1592 domain-containing protein n=1 Tax=Paraglaciecola algarum TaxID=3050085 RepID=A0ABS9D1M2_9ALTE|nr:DUF1592 domain-containing protein [Paraglaciecola sp. G1-23]MCF2946816.1 DUF1592 domain-containing protein [Paraglaciecola sp. G1-23]